MRAYLDWKADRSEGAELSLKALSEFWLLKE